ncbi:MAG: hypothetical protein RIE53_01250 [Rhodothermales bacterium]
MSDRLYNEKEIASILRRASTLSPDASDETRVGLSLEELRQVGAESGLDPDAVEAAAAELEARPTTTLPAGIFGGPLTHTSTVVIDHELSGEKWEDMLVAIRKSFGKPGIVQTRPHVYEWVTPESFSGESGHVLATVRNGKTKIQVFWSDPTSAIPFFIPTIIGAVILLPILFEELSMGFTGIPVWMAIVAINFMLSRFGVSVRGRMGIRKVERLAEELRTMGTKAASPSQTTSTAAPAEVAMTDSAFRLDVDDQTTPTTEKSASRKRVR